MNQLALNSWLAALPRRFYSLWCRSEQRPINEARRLKLRQSLRRLTLIAFPLANHWADRDVHDYLAGRVLQASIEESWHQNMAIARTCLRHGQKDEARKFLLHAAWIRTCRLRKIA